MQDTLNNNQTNKWDHNKRLSELAENYQHIKGWGIDADPTNEPTHPMKKYTGDDHNRTNYERPEQQPVDVEILHSNERPNVTAVFGTPNPPSGLSGALRRFAFRYSEESLRHWFTLVLADRINVIEGIVDDISKGIIPNIIAEKGMGAAWKYNKKQVIVKNAVIGAGIAIAIMALSKKKKGKRSNRYRGSHPSFL